MNWYLSLSIANSFIIAQYYFTAPWKEPYVMSHSVFIKTLSEIVIAFKAHPSLLFSSVRLFQISDILENRQSFHHSNGLWATLEKASSRQPIYHPATPIGCSHIRCSAPTDYSLHQASSRNKPYWYTKYPHNRHISYDNRKRMLGNISVTRLWWLRSLGAVEECQIRGCGDNHRSWFHLHNWVYVHELYATREGSKINAVLRCDCREWRAVSCYEKESCWERPRDRPHHKSPECCPYSSND